MFINGNLRKGDVIYMSNVKLFTDSTCDLSTELLNKYDISIVPLYVNFDDCMYKDQIELSTEELYVKVTEKNKLPKTAAPSPTDFSNAFKPYIDNGQDILYIGLSSMISSAINNAVLACNEFPEGRIKIIDSMNLSSGIGLLVLKAADFINEGMDLNIIADKIQELVPKVRTAFVIDTLDFLYKGGRCSALQNIASSVLKIKPVISVVNGKMIVREKIRGKRHKVLETLLNSVLKKKDTIDLTRIMITHSMSNEDAVFLKKELQKSLNAKEIIITDAGCVISSHCGENTVGILYIEK